MLPFLYLFIGSSTNVCFFLNNEKFFCNDLFKGYHIICGYSLF